MRVMYNSSPTQVNSFFQNLDDCRNDGTFCDLTFEVGYEQFPCHRIIVASASPYFQVLLSNAFKEKSLNSIVLHDIESEIFALLLNYIYNRKIELDENNVQQILLASDMFQLDEVFQFCCHYLSISLNEKNVIDIWKISNELNCTNLKNDAEYCMLQRFRSLIELDLIQTLPYDLLKKLISNDELIVDNEQQVFKGLILWLIHNPEQIRDELFECIRFDYISKEHRDVILNQIRETNSPMTSRIERILSYREGLINNIPARRGTRQTCYIFGGYGCRLNENDVHLLSNSYRCHMTVDESSSSYTLDIQQIHGDEMRYARMHHQSAALGSLIYVVGGEDGVNIFSSVEVFDPLSKLNNRQWIQTGSMVNPRCNFGLIAIDSNTLMALGGHIGANITSTIEIFDCKTGIWTLLPYKLRSPCYGFACVQLNGSILCIGGSQTFDSPVRTTEIFNPKTGLSYLCADMIEARTFCSVCLDDEQDRIYVFGGADSNGNGLCSAEVYNSYHCRWYPLPSMLFERVSPCVYRIGYLIIVFGGRTSLALDAEILNTAEIFHIEKQTWIRTNDLPIRLYGATTILR